MKSIFIILFAGLSIMQGYSQYTPTFNKKFDKKTLKAIARQVIADVSTKKNFDRFDLFQVYKNDSLQDALHSGADSFVVLSINYDALSSLLSLSPQHVVLTIPSINEGSTELILFKHEISTPEFQIKTSSGKSFPGDVHRGIHYWGIIKDQYQSLVAISIFENEVMGFMANGSGNVVIGKLNESEQYVVYNEQHLKAKNNFVCGNSLDVNKPLSLIKPIPENANTLKCVKVYWEINTDIYIDKGGLIQTSNFAEGMFNQSQIIFFNDNIDINLNELKIWDIPSPYEGKDSYEWLYSFEDNLEEFNGDIGHLLAYSNYGGVANVYGLCNWWDDRKCYSGLNKGFKNFPLYSWNINVISHEQGHVLGSYHTHDCIWNGDDTAIDGCGPAAGWVGNGGCLDGPIPPKGTIMSYCYLPPNSGNDFSLGFGIQPANVIINEINAAQCLTKCTPCISVGANDHCNTAVLLQTDSTCNYTGGTICNATADYSTGSSCTLGGENINTYDVWYKFVATCNDIVVNVKGANIFDPVCEIYDGPCGIQIDSCIDNTGIGGLEKVFLSGLILGKTYFIRIYDFYQNQKSGESNEPDFEICINCQEPRPNLANDISGQNNIIINGNNINMTIDIFNNGNVGTVKQCMVSYYLSYDTNIDPLDYKIGTDSIKEINVNEHIIHNIQVNACDFLPASSKGKYYIGFIIDSENEIYESEENDNAISFYESELNCCVIPESPPILKSNMPQCGNVVLSRPGNPPPGIKWYWQGWSCNDLKSLGSDSIFIATEENTYYLRAYNEIGDCWSEDCSSINVVFTGGPPPPNIPVSNSPQCKEVTLTQSGIPPPGLQWYWQYNCGTSFTYGNNTSITLPFGGNFYLRAYDTLSKCWSLECASIQINVKPPPYIFPLKFSNNYLIAQLVNPNYKIQWFYLNNLVGTSNDSLLCLGNGDYYHVLTNKEGCTSTSDVLNVTNCIVSATDLISNNNIKVFPNPVSDVLIIKGEGLKNGDIEISLFNSLGEKLKKINTKVNQQKINIELDLKDYPPGIYFLSIYEGTTVSTFKVVKM